LSTDPGSQPGMPGTGGKGSLAMSPAGGDKPGLGGSGGGSGIGNGTGPGSGLTGENSGAGKSGAGRGSDPNARGGISPTPGPGGAGTAPTGIPAAPGVDVRGGSTVVNLPSFDSGSSNAPSLPGRSSVKGDPGPAITIVATSRSGGAFDFYGKLPGDNYTVYVDTNIGTVVMQFAEVDPATNPPAGALTGPQGLRTDLPQNLPRARVVIKCKLDASGNLKNLQVLEPGPAAMTAKSWPPCPAGNSAPPPAAPSPSKSMPSSASTSTPTTAIKLGYVRSGAGIASAAELFAPRIILRSRGIPFPFTIDRREFLNFKCAGSRLEDACSTVEERRFSACPQKSARKASDDWGFSPCLHFCLNRAIN
jgi:hypothetical protein